MAKVRSQKEIEKDRARARRWKANNKERVAAYNKDYYWNDVEAQRQRVKVYREANPEKVKKLYKDWCRKNPNRVKELARINYLKVDPEQNRKRVREWFRSDPERARRLAREWKKKHPDRVNATNSARRALKLGAVGKCSAADRTARAEMFGNLCSYCGGPFEEMDHVIPLTLGGTNWPANLRPCCASCNSSKNNTPDWFLWVVHGAAFGKRFSENLRKGKKKGGKLTR